MERHKSILMQITIKFTGFIDNEEKWGSKVAGYVVYIAGSALYDKEAVIVAVAHGF